ncbi:MAG TPA: hypothetical protein VJX23_11600 [Candidatus Binataceae bacterium]|nr:hypothetical protein [Candidatus Binataceae bacterium]
MTELNSSGGLVGNFAPSGANFNYPYGVTIDAAGNAWVTNAAGSSVTELNSSGGLVGNFAVGDEPDAVAIDAAGNVWVANGVGNSVTELDSSGGLAGNFAPRGANFNYPYAVAIDAAGNVWVTSGAAVPNGPQPSVAELVGAARPVLTPLVACLKQSPPHAVCLP